MPIQTHFVIEGLPAALRRVTSLKQPELGRRAKRSLTAAMRKVLVPSIIDHTPHRFGGHGGKYPTKDLLTKRQKITVRSVRLRAGEVTAVSVKPRVWFEHFVAGGTDPHFIPARSGGSLLFRGHFSAGVMHPGAQAQDYIHDAAQGKEGAIVDQLARDLMKQPK